MPTQSAAASAGAEVESVRDEPLQRLRLLHELYVDPVPRESAHLPFKRAAVAFMQWQLRRGLLNPMDGSPPGSPWWRAINERLLRETYEARSLSRGAAGSPSSAGVQAGVEFIRTPTARSWYRAHNTIVVSAYLDNAVLAQRESRVERFVLNLVLLRVLYAHALVAAPRLALGRLAPLAPMLGDPRLGVTAIFLSLSRVLPDRYPLGEDVTPFVNNEHGFGRFLDIGVIEPRLRPLYDWSTAELGIPRLAALLDGDTPAYAWDPSDRDPWYPAPTRLAWLARKALRPEP